MLRFTTMGRLDFIDSAGTSVPIRRKDFAFLVFIAMRAPRRVTRAEACALFWGDRSSHAARLSLRQAVWRLRRQIPDVIHATDEEVWLSDAVSVDVLEVEHAAAAGAYDRVVAHVQGEFLAGADDVGTAEYEHWLDEIRARVRVCLALSLQRLVQDAFARDDFASAVTHARRWVEVQPLEQAAALEYARSLRASGRASEAMVALNAFDDRQTELGKRASLELRQAQKNAHTAIVAQERLNGPNITELLELYEQARVGGSFAAQVVGDHRAAAIVRMLRALRASGGDALVLRGLSLGDTLSALAHARGLAGASAGALDVLAASVPALRGRFASVQSQLSLESAACEVIAAVAEETPVLLIIDDAASVDLAYETTLTAIIKAAIPRVVVLACASSPVAWLADSTTIFAAHSNAPPSRRNRVTRAIAVVTLLAVVIGSQHASSPERMPADSGTTSLTAYRFYQEGLQKYYAQDRAGAATLFHAAFRADSTFAMAVYYAHLVELWGDTKNQLLDRAHRLAQHAPQRDRLKINAAWSIYTADGNLRAIAETLSMRYPNEPDGSYYRGHVEWDAGRFSAAIPHYRRTILMDTAGLRGHADHCRACQAMERLTGMYRDLDSLEVAERFARTWVQLQPRSVAAWDNLGGTIEYTGRLDDAASAYERAEALDPGVYDITGHRIELALRRGDFANADSMIAAMIANEDHITMGDGLIVRTMSLRMQGRFREAVTAWNRYRTGWRDPRDRTTNGSGTARIMFEAGAHDAALALYDSVADVYLRQTAPEHQRHLAVVYANVALARYALQDTVALRELEMKVRKWGSYDASARYQNLHYYVRGLRQRSQNDYAGAAQSFAAARLSPTNGNVRASYALAETLLAAGKPAESIPILQAAIRGALGSSGSAVTKSELHALLGEAFDAAGARDSAVVHYDWTVRAWTRADAELAARRAHYRARISALRE